jgi:hypothetical protein
VGVEEGHDVDCDANSSATRIGHRLGQLAVAVSLAHLPQHMPVRESANQGGVVGGQFGDDALYPGRHAFDPDLHWFEHADGDEETV